MEDKNPETDSYHSQAHMISAHPGANPISHHIPHHPAPRQDVSNELPPPPPTYEEKPNHKGKWILIFLILLFIVLVPIGLYFFLNSINKSSNENAVPSPTQAVACTQEAKICPDGSAVGREGPNCEFTPCPTTGTASAKMETFTSAKFPDMSLKGYTITYPSTWTYLEDRDDSAQVSKLTLSKDGYSLTILQAPMGGGGCIFEGETPAGPFTDYRNSKTTDIKTSFGNLRKAEDVSNNITNYNYCQESSAGQNSFGTITSIGVISAKAPAVPDPKIIAEIDEMLKGVKIN